MSRCVISCFVIGALAATALADETLRPVNEVTNATEADGHGWPLVYVPAEEIVQPPSHRLLRDTTIEYPMQALPELAARTLMAEDEALAIASGRLRAGINRDLDTSAPGAWYDASDGGRIWTAAYSSPGAVKLRLHFVGVNLPEGAELYVYSPDEPQRVRGPYTGVGPHGDGSFWAASTNGAECYVECYVPPTADPAVFYIDKLAHLHRGGEATGGGITVRAWNDCMVDPPCASDWPNFEDESYSVAQLSYYSNDDGGGWYNCTGTLLATQANDFTPYMLTAQHCVDDSVEADSLECTWFYQRQNCGSWPMTTQSTSEAVVLDHGSGGDWSFLMLKGVLPAGVFWSGWTSSNPSNNTWAVILHHPGGETKRYSRGRSYSASTNYNHIYFDTSGAVGAIYFGTSGSSVWRESDKKVFGNASYTYGDPGCDHPESEAGYGKLSRYYSQISGYLAEGSDDALDDNDACVDARSVLAGSYTDLVVKSVDDDWYAIDVPSDTRVTVDLTFTDNHGNIDARLYDGCAGPLVASGTTYSNNEQLVYDNSGAATTVYLRVYLADDTRNTYDMTVELDCRPPDFTQQPPANQDLCTGDSAFFTVAVDVANAGYQWRRGTTDLVDDGSHILGATTATLEIRDLTLADEASDYNCLVTNLDDGCVAVSDDAGITLSESITIIDQPDDTGGLEGAFVLLGVTANGGGELTHQWYKGDDPLVDGGHISGATTPNVIFNPAELADSGQYHCEITNACGTVESDTVSLTIFPLNGCRGDCDCDGDRDYFDIEYLLAALDGQAQWEQFYRDTHGGSNPTCSYSFNCDVDAQGDGTTYFDINPFLDLIGQPCY